MSTVDGVGLGLRFAFLDELVERSGDPLPALRWLECHPENYMRRGGRFPAGLTRLRERWPFATHGLSMSLGGVDPLDGEYLRTLRGFLDEVQSPWHSDHLCVSIAHGRASHDLLSMSFNEELVRHLVARIRQAQDRLSTPLAVENVSYYALPPDSDLDEGDFVSAVCAEADCLLMLDVNNVYVNAFNHGQDARAILTKMPLERVVQMHVAGHFYEEPDFILDTHDTAIVDPVYELLEWTLARTGRVPVLLERDSEIPAWDDLYAELVRLDALWRAAPERGRAPRSRGARGTGALTRNTGRLPAGQADDAGGMLRHGNTP
ncbi:MAG: DUF692 domain-containing protein [Myxococcales bacterium]|nr:DUF692 domain-containing protein [Myxococcales bacterium]